MFENITKSDIVNAAEDIRMNGIQKNIFNGNQKHWVQFPNGNEYPFKELVRRAHKYAVGTELNFTSTENNRAEFQQRFSFEIKKYPEGVNFFSKDELERFRSIAGKSYRKEDELSSQRKKQFWPTFVRSNKWADLLRERLSGYTVENNYRWQTGYSFRKYTWHKIYKPGDKDTLVFFTIGVDGGNIEREDPAKLVIKLDCMRDTHGDGEVLPKEKVELYYQFIDQYDDRLRIEVLPKKLKSLDWTSLIDKTYEYIIKREQDYEDLIKHIHQVENLEQIVDENFSPVTVSEKPKEINSLISDDPSFTGSNTDWEKEQRRARIQGLSGEQFIRIQCELNPDIFELGSNVKELKKQQDGKGYDFLAVLETGEKYYLEVKSTTGSIKRPFYMSRNEKEFLKRYFQNYRLIRVYELNKVLKKGHFYILSGEFLMSNTVRFKPTSYEISIKGV